eukprot:256848-Pelagomonas_calceolata.AAC.3
MKASKKITRKKKQEAIMRKKQQGISPSPFFSHGGGDTRCLDPRRVHEYGMAAAAPAWVHLQHDPEAAEMLSPMRGVVRSCWCWGARVYNGGLQPETLADGS